MSNEGTGGAFVNSHGYVHDMITLHRATNTSCEGEPETEHSWFPGYAWTIAYCAGCANHLVSDGLFLCWSAQMPWLFAVCKWQCNLRLNLSAGKCLEQCPVSLSSGYSLVLTWSLIDRCNMQLRHSAAQGRLDGTCLYGFCMSCTCHNNISTGTLHFALILWQLCGLTSLEKVARVPQSTSECASVHALVLLEDCVIGAQCGA